MNKLMAVFEPDKDNINRPTYPCEQIDLILHQTDLSCHNHSFRRGIRRKNERIRIDLVHPLWYFVYPANQRRSSISFPCLEAKDQVQTCHDHFLYPQEDL